MSPACLRFVLTTVSAMGLTVTVLAQEPKPWRAANVKAVAAWTTAQQQRFAGNTNVWVRRGLVADRRSRKVEIVAEATGLDAGAIAEFLLVGEGSEKDYEALAVAFARGGDLVRGLEFIGVPRGRPVNSAACQFWPRGERVRATVRVLGSDEAKAWPLQSCLADKRKDMSPPDTFVAVGSCWTGGAANATCLADEASPGGLIATYNERTVVLDVPSQSPQGEVYGNLVVAPQHTFEGGALLTMAFTPEPRPDGRPRVIDVSLDVGRKPDAQGDGLGTVVCATRGADASLPPATNDVKGAIERLAGLAKSGHDPFVAVTLDDSVTASTVRDLARVLKAVEGEGGIRVEPPPAGQLYYKAFLPDDKWRARGERIAQPWELRLGRDKGGVWRYTLVQILEDWSKQGQINPDLTVKEHPLDRWEDLPDRIKALGGGINTLFVFAPGDAPLSTFMPAVRQVRALLPTVYIFCE